MIITILTKTGRRLGEHSENYNKETENIREYQTKVTELKNVTTKLKNTLEGLSNRMDEEREWIRELEDKAMEIIQRSKKKKRLRK